MAVCIVLLLGLGLAVPFVWALADHCGLLWLFVPATILLPVARACYSLWDTWPNRVHKLFENVERDLASLESIVLDKFVSDELERARILDEKIHRWIVALPITVTVGGFALPAMFQNLEGITKYVAAGFVFSAIFSLVIGIVVAVQGMAPRVRRAYSAVYLQAVSHPLTARDAMIKAIFNFHVDNYIRAKQSQFSGELTVLGIIYFAVAIITSLYDFAFDLPMGNVCREN